MSADMEMYVCERCRVAKMVELCDIHIEYEDVDTPAKFISFPCLCQDNAQTTHRRVVPNE